MRRHRDSGPAPHTIAIFCFVALGACLRPSVSLAAPVFAGCMEDVAGFSLGCNANDIQIASVTNVVVQDDGCTSPGDTVTFDADVKLLLTAQARHDVGIYIATDGGDALNGSCLIDVLPYTPDLPYLDLDGTGDDPNGVIQDTCGDIDATHNPITTFIQGITVACLDKNDDGKLDLPNCLSWRQPGANELCTNPLDAFPGAPSKCRCSTLNVIDILVPPGDIDLTKTATPDELPEPGGLVTFDVVIDNPSLVEVTVNTLVDSIYGDLNGQGTCSVPQVIAAGGSYACSFTAVVSGGPGTIETDVVTAEGIDFNLDPVSDADDATVSILDVPSALSLVKVASPTTVPEPGGPVTFTVTVTNDSVVDDVTIDTLTDSIHGDLNGQGTCSVPQVLAPGASYVCSFVANVVGPEGFIETDTAIASGFDDDGNPLSAQDPANVTVTNVPSEITVVKSANPTSLPEPGGLVTFSVTITNDSPVDEVTIDTLTDSIHGNLDGQGDCSVPQLLLVGGSYSCSFQANVFGDPGDSETDIVTGSGQDDDGDPVSGIDSATVQINDVPSSISVDKTATPPSLPEPGGPVTFDVLVTNDSAVDDVTIDTLTDSIHGDLDGQGSCSVPQVLAPGASYACSFVADVLGLGGSNEIDLVVASGLDDDGVPVSDDDDAQVDIIDVASVLDVVKTVAPGVVEAPGGPVMFAVQVINSSPVDTITVNSLVDDIHGDLNGQGDCAVPQILVPGETYECSFTANVNGNSGDMEQDTVTASGIDDDGFPVEGSDIANVFVIACGDGVLQPGEECDDGNQEFGDGCTSTCQLEIAITPICHHRCPSKIKFGSPLGKFYTKVGLVPTNPFDPTTATIGLTLLNANGEIFSGMLFPGDMVKKGRSYRFKDKAARTGAGIRDGIFSVKMNRRSDGLWRFQMKAYADLSAATESEMTLIIQLDGDVFTITTDWIELKNGWAIDFKFI